MRAIAAIVAGLVVGILGMVGFGAAGSLLVTVNGSANLSDTNQLASVFADMPTGAKAVVMVAWFGGGLIGAAAAKLIERRGWVAWTVAALLALLVFGNVLILPMPGWMQVLAVAGPLLGGLIANHLIADRARATAEAEVEAPEA